MAILKSRTRTGISWIGESIALFKLSPRKWLLLALAYLGLFVFLPTTPGLQVIFAFVTTLGWPLFVVFAMRLYRNAEFKKEESFSAVVELIKPNALTLVKLGFVSLLYIILLSSLLSQDLLPMTEVMNKQGEMTEAELTAAAQALMPIFFKLVIGFIPLLMMNWFSPMLIAFNQYPLFKAIKSSIAGSLQYVVALLAAWLLLSASMMMLMMVATTVVGLFALVNPSIIQPLATAVVFACFLLSIALAFAFQYVSYRDVFRAA